MQPWMFLHRHSLLLCKHYCTYYGLCDSLTIKFSIRAFHGVCGMRWLLFLVSCLEEYKDFVVCDSKMRNIEPLLFL